jgi:hypothetical protein
MMGTRKREVRNAYALSASLLAMLLVAVLLSGCGRPQTQLTTTTTTVQAPVSTDFSNVQEQLDAHKAAAAQLLVQNSQLREFLENDIYELSGDVYITTYEDIGDSAAVILSDGRLIMPDGYSDEWYEAVKGYEPTIVELFDRLKCEDVYLSTEAGNKTLTVLLGDFKIGEDRYYSEFLSYSRADAVEMAESVMPNWYYAAWLYEVAGFCWTARETS